MVFDILNLAPIVPEVVMAIVALGLLMVGAFGGSKALPLVNFGTILTLLVSICLLWVHSKDTSSGFDGMVIANGFTNLSKILILTGAALVLFISFDWQEKEVSGVFEYPVLVLLSVLGMMVMVSAGSMLVLYMGLELMSLPLYVLASIQRDSLRSTEAGLKYFVLGSLASGITLFGMSLVYGFTGTLQFDALATVFGGAASIAQATHMPMQVSGGAMVGMLLLMIGFFFKISAVPFHMWTPDVYEGAPTPVTAFFAVAPKIAALTILTRLLLEPFGDLHAYWQQIVIFVSVFSMFVGAVGALMQTNIKRLLAYSSIGHVGYALIGIASGSREGAQAIFIYLAIYLIMSVGTFCCVLLMRRKGEYIEEISELSGLSKSRPLFAAALAVFMFSLAGIPPLAGFFGKMYIFMSAIKGGLYGLAVIGVLTSVIGAFYYLKIVKIMYLDEEKLPFDRSMSLNMRLVMGGCGLFTVGYFLYPTPLILYAKQAAQALLL